MSETPGGPLWREAAGGSWEWQSSDGIWHPAPPQSGPPLPPPPVSQAYATGPPFLAAQSAKRRINRFASASLVMSLVVPLVIGSILAIIFGHVARRQIRESNGTQRGRGLAIAGEVIGWVCLAIVIILFVAQYMGVGNNSTTGSDQSMPGSSSKSAQLIWLHKTAIPIDDAINNDQVAINDAVATSPPITASTIALLRKAFVSMDMDLATADLKLADVANGTAGVSYNAPIVVAWNTTIEAQSLYATACGKFISSKAFPTGSSACTNAGNAMESAIGKWNVAVTKLQGFPATGTTFPSTTTLPTSATPTTSPAKAGSAMTGVAISSFPQPVSEALAFLQGKSSVPLAGPTNLSTTGMSATATVAANGGYSVDLYSCPTPLPLNSPDITNGCEDQVNSVGGFGATPETSDAAALSALPSVVSLGELAACPRGSPTTALGRQNVATCGIPPGNAGSQPSGPAEASWKEGDWTIVYSLGGDLSWQQVVLPLITQLNQVLLPPHRGYFGVTEAPDGEYASMAWAVGSTVFSIYNDHSAVGAVGGRAVCT